MVTRITYQVIVVNVGTVYDGPDKETGYDIYTDYCNLSTRGIGLGGCQNVTMICREETVMCELHGIDD